MIVVPGPLSIYVQVESNCIHGRLLDTNADIYILYIYIYIYIYVVFQTHPIYAVRNELHLRAVFCVLLLETI